MLVVPGADADGVNLGEFFEHHVFIGVKTGNAVFLAHFFQAVFPDVAERIKLHVGVFQVAVDVGFGDVTDADHGDFQFLVHEDPSFWEYGCWSTAACYP